MLTYRVSLFLANWSKKGLILKFDASLIEWLCNSIMLPQNIEYRHKNPLPPLIEQSFKYLRDSNEEFRCTNWVWAGLPMQRGICGGYGDCEDLATDLASEFCMQGAKAKVFVYSPRPNLLHCVTQVGKKAN